MKRLVTLVLAAGLVLSAASGAQAIEFKASGQWLMGFNAADGSLVNKTRGGQGEKMKKANNEDVFSAGQRIRLQLDAVASEALSGTVFFEIGHQRWGQGGDSGAAMGADGTIYASGGEHLASTSSAGIYALNPNGTLKWHYPSGASVQTSPVVDSRGYIHFVDAEATYYVLTAEGELYSSISLGDACASSPVMDAQGNLYVAVNANGQYQVVCASSKGDSYATDSPWPMRGGNPQRTGLQK